MRVEFGRRVSVIGEVLKTGGSLLFGILLPNESNCREERPSKVFDVAVISL